MGRQRLKAARVAQANPVDQHTPNLGNATGSSKHDEPKAPKPKRQRTNQDLKTVTQKKQAPGQLSGLMKMPIDIFTEVASHLMPKDIIILSRSNKFLRNLLMRRSAVHIWHGAMRNVPKLPPCPPDMCEPRYLALTYMPTCSMCGGSSPKRMDETLRVRLCNPCFDDRTMSVDGLPADIQTLVPKTAEQYRRNYDFRYSALRTDVAMVLAKTEELKQSRNNTALTNWKRDRLEEVVTRKKQAAVLGEFLNYLEDQEIRRQASLRQERRAEIERRLVLLGWDAKDLRSRYANWRELERLVDQPVPITERIWADIKPKLIPMVRANRTARLAEEKAERKRARRLQLERIMNEIKAADPLLIDTTILTPAPCSSPDPVRVIHRRLFPLAVDLLEYPIIKSLDETDIPGSDMEARFEEHREAIEAHVLEWRIKVEGHLAEVLRQGRVSDGLKKAAPAPKLPVGKSASNPFTGVSDDLKLLLRADSLFESKTGPLSIPVAYNYLLSSSLSNMWGVCRETPLDLTQFNRDGKAQAIARALLAGLGKTNASFLELQSIGPRFKCGSCQSKMTHTWTEIIHHYADEQRKWERFQAYLPNAPEHEIEFRHLHALDSRPKKSLVKLLDSIPDDSDSEHYSGSTNFKCLLCKKVGVIDDGATKDEIIEHIINWHGVAEPQQVEHYDKFGRDYSDDEDEDDDSDSGWCPGCQTYHSDSD
ncbi:hypothetical protein BDV93DRAFT_502159 [Ceratobasidium sp. AG-I]|nr:hypothetical protein BDV93DRAFT_502159 [Ceratobasidium sp. AG-I]